MCFYPTEETARPSVLASITHVFCPGHNSNTLPWIVFEIDRHIVYDEEISAQKDFFKMAAILKWQNSFFCKFQKFLLIFHAKKGKNIPSPFF